MRLTLTLARLGGALPQRVHNANAAWQRREGILVSVAADGLRAWGEASPLPGYSQDTLEETEAALRALPPSFSLDASSLDTFAGSVAERVASLPSSARAARFGLESALFDLYAKRQQVPLWATLRHVVADDKRVRGQVPTQMPIAAWIDPADLDRVATLFGEGVRTFKIKLGRDLPEELRASRALRERFPGVRLRFDANRSLLTSEVDAALAALAALDVEFVEEPAIALPARSPLPLALDESLHAAPWSPPKEHPDVRVWVLKPTVLGGLVPCLKMAQEAASRGVEVVVSHTLEGPVARAALAELALAIGGARAAGIGEHEALLALRPPFEFRAFALQGASSLRPHAGHGLGQADVDLSVEQAAREYPDRVAVDAPSETLTYGQLAERVGAEVRDLRARGFRAGDCVALAPDTDVQTVVRVYAAFSLRLCLLPLHPRATAFEQAQLKGIADAFDYDEPHPRGRGATETPPPPLLSDESALAIMFTSGTTGVPKGALLSRRAFIASAWASARRLGMANSSVNEACEVGAAGDAAERWLLTLPPAHVGGLSILTRMLIARGTVVLAPPGPFSASALAETLDARRVTRVSLVPTMLGRLLDSGWRPQATLRTILLGGAAADPGLIERARALGLPLRGTYGLTEACSQVATQASADEPGCGLPLDGVEVRAREGVLEVRGPTLLSRYLGGAPSVDDEGWFRTGDLGEVDAEGRVHVRGRRHDLIITGGENVYPAEVEAELGRQPGVLAAAVVGLPDAEWGQRVVALCVLDPCDSTPPRERLLLVHQALSARLARFKQPKSYALVSTLPASALGKILRAELPALYAGAPETFEARELG